MTDPNMLHNIEGGGGEEFEDITKSQKQAVIVPETDAEIAQKKDRGRNIEKRSDGAIVISEIYKAVKKSESGGLSTETFVKAFNEKHEGEEISPEMVDKIIKASEFIHKQVSKAENREILEKYKDAEEKIAKVILQPIFEGNLDPEELTMIMGGGIEIVDKKQGADEKGDVDYKKNPIAFYMKNKMYIREELLEGKCKDGDKMIKLDFEHTVTHEMAHGVIEAVSVVPERAVKLAKKIINSAEQMGKYQTKHIQNNLKRYKEEMDEFDKLPDEEKNRLGGREAFKQKKEADLANEIITDYYSIFLRSSGEKSDYLRKYFEVVYNTEFYKNVATELGVSGDEKKLINYFRKNSSEEGGIEKMVEKSPTLKKMLENGNEFYVACQEISNLELSDENVGDLDDMYSEGYGGYYAADQPSSSSGKEGKDGGIKEVATNLLAGFAGEVDITKQST